MKKKLLIMFILCLVFSSISAFTVYADDTDNEDLMKKYNIELPDVESYRPEVKIGEIGAKGFITVVNIVTGVICVFILALIGPSLVVDIIPVLRGKQKIGELKSRLIAVSACVGITLLTLSGLWAPIVFFLWEKLLLPIINAFLGR